MAATVEAVELPSGGRAVDLDATRSGLRRHWLRCLALLGAGFALTVAGGLLLGVAGYPEREGPAATVAGLISVVGLLVMGFGGFVALAAMRLRWCLARHPWRSWSCRFREVPSASTPNGSPTLVLTGPEQEEFTLSVVSVAWRWRALEACDGQHVWFAGEPERGGVVAPPGGRHLLLTQRPLLKGRRERLRRETAQQPGT